MAWRLGPYSVGHLEAVPTIDMMVDRYLELATKQDMLDREKKRVFERIHNYMQETGVTELDLGDRVLSLKQTTRRVKHEGLMLDKASHLGIDIAQHVKLDPASLARAINDVGGDSVMRDIVVIESHTPKVVVDVKTLDPGFIPPPQDEESL